MGWRTVVITKPSKLDLKLCYLVIRNVETMQRIYLNEISVLIIENTASSITTALLNELTKQKIKVIFCDEKRNPSCELISYYGCHDSSQKLRAQMKWKDLNKKAVWTEIVTQKIRMQAENLHYFNLNEASLLYQYVDEIEFFDASNREGHAAKVYFHALFGKEFSRSVESPINAALNYGYGIILSCFNREIVCCGYSTQLGLFHDNMFNPFNLACDLMEPFRPIVDRAVKNRNPEKFEKDEKKYVLSLLSEEFVVDGRRQTLLNTIKFYSKSVFDAIENGDASRIKFYRYEL